MEFIGSLAIALSIYVGGMYLFLNEKYDNRSIYEFSCESIVGIPTS